MENVPLQLLKKTTLLSSNSEVSSAGRVTFPFPIEILTCGSKKCPILFGRNRVSSPGLCGTALSDDSKAFRAACQNHHVCFYIDVNVGLV
ncbi:hypothetical protein FF1_041873 [Malus domestica]